MASEQQVIVKSPVTLCKYSKRVSLKTIVGSSDGGLELAGKRVVIGGWVKSSNEAALPAQEVGGGGAAAVVTVGSKDVGCVEILPFFRSLMKVLGGSQQQQHPSRGKLDSGVPKMPPTAVLQVSDGSCVATLQVRVDSSIRRPSEIMPTGTCIVVKGTLQQPAVKENKHAIELKVEKVIHVGPVDQDKYPLSKKRLPLEFLRDFPHFRPRTTTVACVTRIRNAFTQAAHTFFMNNGFLYVQLPIITTTDCDGLSEKFQVTTLLRKELKKEVISTGDSARVSLETVKASIEDKKKLVEELKIKSESNKEKLISALQDLCKAYELAAQLEAREKANKSGTLVITERVDFSDDFFSHQTYLTVSGRLHLESYACALGNVYSFGPRFRAEKPDSKKQVAEMWMIELEMAFSQLEDAMKCAEDFLKFVCEWAIEKCSEDLKFLSKRADQTIIDRLQSMVSSSFESVTYAEAVDVLKQVKDKKFEKQIEWGAPLSEEHESYLADEIYKSPVIIHNYLKELKPFYVRLNDDGRTVAAFDVVVPKAGTLISGSQNEERFSVLNTRIKEQSLPKEQYEWYLDLRRHGTIPHSGFSLMFDLLVLYATDLIDVRDVIPFPRSHGKTNN
ncbi:unnamed protein product [Camellia sinensis]